MWNVMHCGTTVLEFWDTRQLAAVAAVDRYQRFLRECRLNGQDDFYQLRGKDLACWCPLDQPCHADVLLELANASPALDERSPQEKKP